jgi:exosortase/archaeosortase family protein
MKYRSHYLFHVILFLSLYGLFYWGNKFFIGITVPGGMYNAWLAEHFNYVRGFRNFLLQSAAWLIRSLGHTTAIGPYKILIDGGRGVQLVYNCLGFSVFSFWWAMILAFPQTIKNKLIYLFGGTAIIIVLNIVRIAMVGLAYNSEWGRQNRNVDHHLIFNVIVYGILFYMLYRWFNIKPKENSQTISTHSNNMEREIEPINH